MAFRILNEQGKETRACVKIDIGRFFLSLSTVMGAPEMRVFYAAKKGDEPRDVTIEFFPDYSGNAVYPSAENIGHCAIDAEAVLDKLSL